MAVRRQIAAFLIAGSGDQSEMIDGVGGGGARQTGCSLRPVEIAFSTPFTFSGDTYSGYRILASLENATTAAKGHGVET